MVWIVNNLRNILDTSPEHKPHHVTTLDNIMFVLSYCCLQNFQNVILDYVVHQVFSSQSSLFFSAPVSLYSYSFFR